jgi:hypothetical protein
LKLKEIRINATTDGDGDASVDGSRSVFGRLYAVQWIDGDFTDGVDAVISTQNHDAAKTLLTLTNANNDALYYPRDLFHDAAGAALTGTQGGDRSFPSMVGLPRLVVSSGGATKTGGCILFYFED